VSTAIQCEGVEKTFVKARSLRQLITRPLGRGDPVHALRGVDLQVARGEILGLLGPNGAGKTTLIKILSCLILPDRGSVRVGGADTNDENRVKRQIGLVHSDERSFYWRLTARDNLRFFARLYDLPGPRIDARIAELLRVVDMGDAADRPFSGYSSGMKQRIGIARALLHDPPILLMDEPTRSLDPVSSAELRRFVREELRDRYGKTVLLATHDLAEAEQLADRVAILVHGRVRQIGSVDEVRGWGVNGREFLLELEPGSGRLEGPFSVVLDETAAGRRTVRVMLHDGAELNDLLRPLIERGITIARCDRVEQDLESAFARALKLDEGTDA
jgi:ABC-2 type transport system ATP-binding protein